MNFGLTIDITSVEEMSLNSCTGSSTLNTKSFAVDMNSLVISFFCLRYHPKKIIRNTGTVAFRLDIRLLNGQHNTPYSIRTPS
jgi:hypothetical protein